MQKVQMIGRRFGKLTVIDEATPKNGRRQITCRCDCGNIVIVNASNVRRGHTSSCGHCEKYVAIDPNTMRCILPNGKSFVFDKIDFQFVSKHKWSIEDNGYVHSSYNGAHHRLHQALMKPYTGVVDHINGDRTDNRRCNLRIATNKENARNQRIGKRNTSGYKGVSYDRRHQKYAASICVDGKTKFLGYFLDPVKAAIAYDKAAALYFGKFAKPNFGEGGINEQILEVGA